MSPWLPFLGMRNWLAVNSPKECNSAQTMQKSEPTKDRVCTVPGRSTGNWWITVSFTTGSTSTHYCGGIVSAKLPRN